MTTKIRMLAAAIAVAAVVGLLCHSDLSYAGGDPELKSATWKVGDAIKAGKDKDAKTMAADAVKKLDDVEPVMHLFKPRKKDGKGGIGWGKTPLANPAKDGLEVGLREIEGKGAPAGWEKQAAAYEEAGYAIAALADMAKAKGFDKYTGKRTKKEWDRHNDEMRVAAIAFAKAAASKKAAEVKTAAGKLNAICTSCHAIFKD